MHLFLINDCQTLGQIDKTIPSGLDFSEKSSLFSAHDSIWNNDQSIKLAVNIAPKPPGALSLLATWPPGHQDPAGHGGGEIACAIFILVPCGHPGFTTLRASRRLSAPEAVSL